METKEETKEIKKETKKLVRKHRISAYVDETFYRKLMEFVEKKHWSKWGGFTEIIKEALEEYMQKHS